MEVDDVHIPAEGQTDNDEHIKGDFMVSFIKHCLKN